MDPALIGEGSFSVGGVSVGEIWPFGVSGVVGMRIGSRFGHYGSMVDGFLVNRDEPVDGGGSTVTEQSGSFGGEKRKRRDVNEEGLEMVSAAISENQNPLKEINSKRIKVSGSSDENGCSKAGVDCSAGSGSKLEDKHDKHEPPKDYVHVRAPRGQATDSHSLAERARREKITERMKILQDLVPGCNKVIGKAFVLDEIINYVQSLQRQVEFLSMKLDAVNSEIAPAISEFAAKELCPPSFNSLIEQRVPQPEWLHMQLGGGFDRAA